MKKKVFTAKATLINESGGEYDITIYSGYKTVEEANEGIERFKLRGYNIKSIWVE